MTSISSDCSQTLDMPDAEVVYFPCFFEPEEADRLFTSLRDTIAWRHDTIRVYGRTIEQPRLTAWYGDAGKSYMYSGITMNPEPWTAELRDIRERLKSVENAEFNSVLLNLYRNERDSVSWHSDDEPELGTNPVIASVSFGAARRFQFKHKSNPQLRAAVDLTHGSLLLMQGATQHYWNHQIPKSARPHAARINLTFRCIWP